MQWSKSRWFQCFNDVPQICLESRVVEQSINHKTIYIYCFEAAQRFQLLGCRTSCDILLLAYFIIIRAILPISLKTMQQICYSRDMISDVTINKLQSWTKYWDKLYFSCDIAHDGKDSVSIFPEFFTSIDKTSVLGHGLGLGYNALKFWDFPYAF